MEQTAGPLSGKGIKKELVTWVSSVGLSLCISKMELSGTMGPIPRESVERAGVMGQPWRTRVRGAGGMEGEPLLWLPVGWLHDGLCSFPLFSVRLVRKNQIASPH